MCDAARRDTAEALARAVGGVRVETLDEDGGGSLTRLAAAGGGTFATLACDGVALAAILYTSGTTGRSKG